MRAADALATSVTTYAVPLLVLTTTGSTALLLTCSAAQGLALAFRGLRRHRASYTAPHTPAEQAAATHPSPAALAARDAA